MSAHSAGRIGPNAVIRLIEALDQLTDRATTLALFEAAGLSGYVARPPEDMVDEAEVALLHRLVEARLGGECSQAAARIAGQRTAEYLLDRRIPRLAQTLLRLVGAGFASRLLARAIAANAWTFVGTGHFTAQHGHPTRFHIGNCPLCRDRHATAPICTFYAACFEHLYRRLVHPETRVVETACCATGAPACTFAITWPRARRRFAAKALIG